LRYVQEDGAREKGFRAYQGLLDLACAQALLHGNSQIDSMDLDIVRLVTAGSMRPVWLRLVRALAIAKAAGQDGLTAKEVEDTCLISNYKAVQLMKSATL
jgi:hypothetical protein